MKYNKKLNTPNITNRGIGNDCFQTEEEVYFTPKRMETSLDYTIKLAARLARKHYSYASVHNRCSLCYINIIVYNRISLYNTNNNIAQTATLSELSVRDWEQIFKKYAASKHFVDVHLNPRPRKDLNKITKVNKKGFAFVEQRSIFDACIINSKILNDILSYFILDWKSFIPTYEDVKNSVRYWIKLKYRCEDKDISLNELEEYISKNYENYDKYYNFIIKNSNSVYNVARLFYGNTNSWLKYKLRTDRSIKETETIPEEEMYKYYNFKTKKYDIPVKYKHKEEWLEIYEYGSNRSDRWITVTSKNGKYCLWLPNKVRIALGSYYHKNGGDKTKKLLETAYYTKNFNIIENWNTIKVYLSKVKETINKDDHIVLEYGAYIDRIMGEDLTKEDIMPIKNNNLIAELTQQQSDNNDVSGQELPVFDAPVSDVAITNKPNDTGLNYIERPNWRDDDDVIPNSEGMSDDEFFANLEKLL